MTANRNLKRRVRARAAKTGESYAAALRHVRPVHQGDTMPEVTPVRLATAQVVVGEDPRDTAQLRRGGRDVRELMRQARRAGARIIHFPEGATCSPHKRIMSAAGPAEVGPADWDRADWRVLRAELAAIARLAGELRLWTVLGSVHPLTPPHRPHNSMYVISDHGELVTRYDERLLSNTKLSFMYTPGSVPVTFEADGVRFGCAMGIEVHFPEVFAEYERLDADGVLFSTGAGQTPEGTAAFAAEARGHAAANGLWVSFALSAQHSAAAPAGIVAPDGRWAARCAGDGRPALAVADIDNRSESIDIAVTKARPWRRQVRAGIYDAHLVADGRTDDRGAF
jgi:predicted amidohydrolase